MKRTIADSLFPWVRQRGARIAATAAALGAAIALIVVEARVEEQGQRLEGVSAAGPCRAALAKARADGAKDPVAVAIRDSECQQQAELLFAACVTHDLHPACSLAREALRENRNARDRRRQRERDSAPNGSGRSAAPATPPAATSAAPRASESAAATPPAAQDGEDGEDGDRGPKGPPGPQPQPPDDDVGPICDLTDSLGIPLC